MSARSPRLLLPFVAAVYLGLLAPLVVVIAVSFGPSAAFEFPPRGVTLHWFEAFFKITLPLLRSSLVSGAIFAFIISFSDINLALFLSGPQSTSLPVHIFSQIQWQGDPTMAAASSMQIVIIGLLILVVQRIFRLRLVV